MSEPERDEKGQPPADVSDPFSAFLKTRKANVPAPRMRAKFNSGEHVWLGQRGAERACAAFRNATQSPVDAKLFRAILRLRSKEALDYGELVALSGDFYPSPEALFEEKPARLPWLWEGNDLSDIRDTFDGELEWIEGRIEGTELELKYPAKNIRQAWNAKYFVELALSNVDHFGWHNIRAYCRYHQQALALALAAEDDPSHETFRRALYTNAFADHFLTDGFAAGHVRVPRQQIIDWAESHGLNDRIAGALSKLLHDQDGHVDAHHLHGHDDAARAREDDGLRVVNARGQTWFTHCDGQLFLRPGNAASVERPMDAVAASLLELLRAWKLKELPKHHYAATAMVPFPHAEAPELVAKFPSALSERELDRLWKNVDWYTKIPWLSGLERDHIRGLFTALPALMQSFRDAINHDADTDALTALMDPGYVRAYRKIA